MPRGVAGWPPHCHCGYQMGSIPIRGAKFNGCAASLYAAVESPLESDKTRLKPHREYRLQTVHSNYFAGIAQLVERNLAKVEVASSSLVSRSKFCSSLCGDK
jgi:hypothetical protein